MTQECFTDHVGRTITLEEGKDGIQAQHEGRLIARVEVLTLKLEKVKGKAGERYLLKAMEVAPEFRRAGIGLELLAVAKEWFYPLQVPFEGPDGYQALLKAGQRKGWLLKPWPKEHAFLTKMRRGRGDVDF